MILEYKGDFSKVSPRILVSGAWDRNVDSRGTRFLSTGSVLSSKPNFGKSGIGRFWAAFRYVSGGVG